MTNRFLTSIRTYIVVLGVVLCGLSAPPLRAEDAMLTLGDFDLTLGGVRSQFSVEREQAFCIGATGGSNVVFKSEVAPFLIANMTLTAKRDGTVTLIPELFILRDFMWYGMCHGIRIVTPPPDPAAEAFFPPNNAFVEVGHAGDRLTCQKGDSIKIELLFDGLVERDELDAEVLIAVPGVTLRRRPGLRLHTRACD